MARDMTTADRDTRSKGAERSIEYLGSKRRLLPFVAEPISAVATRGQLVADLFCGTGSVAAELKRRGYRVAASDTLLLGATLTAALLLNTETPPFTGLSDSSAVSHGGQLSYRTVVAYLNSLPPVEGFVYESYSPAALLVSGYERMYFSRENAARIDAIRRQIRDWHGQLSRAEESLLLSDLVKAASTVSNVAGTYGSYLKHWKQRALDQLVLVPSPLSDSGQLDGHQVLWGDAESLGSTAGADVVYADPPYTKRQYAAYYHVLETIIRDDRPILSGSTGLRPWESQASDWCYKRKASAALRGLLEAVQPKHFFLSYSSDGHLSHKQIVEALEGRGPTRVWETQSRRYRSNRRRQASSTVIDRLYHLEVRP